MTCETTRQRLLRSERPDRPPADVQPHLVSRDPVQGGVESLDRQRQVGMPVADA